MRQPHLKCAACDAPLKVKSWSKDGLEIVIFPCSACLEGSASLGYDDGYDAGFGDGCSEGRGGVS